MNVIDQEGPITKQKPSLSAYSNDNSFFDKYDVKLLVTIRKHSLSLFKLLELASY